MKVTTRGRYYQIDQGALRYSGAAMCNTRTQAGIKFTLARKGSTQNASDTARTLAIWGTLDPLARTNRMKTYRAKHFKTVTTVRWVRKVA